MKHPEIQQEKEVDCKVVRLTSIVSFQKLTFLKESQ